MRHVRTTKKFRELRRKLRAHIGHGLGTELNSMRRILLFLSSSVPKGSLCPLRVGNPFPVFVSIAFYLIVSHSALRDYKITSIPRSRVRDNPCSIALGYLHQPSKKSQMYYSTASLMQSSILPRGHNCREQHINDEEGFLLCY
ncbi:hypothetical protein HAX54_026908 [Datura stramonium]|uniref:Uncharacterized protein n=2 Tax=Magnoliopsida TaxID=3398 RepID=A0ABS8V1R5_DATST|nr:hypothetical protein [Datura stramonium]